MELLQFRTDLRTMIGSPTTTDVADAKLTRHVNSAYRDIATKYPHYKSRKLCSFPTVDGTMDYGLPSDCGAVLRVWDATSSARIHKRGDAWYADNLDVYTEEDAPQFYVRYRTFVRLIPTPDAVYTIMLYYRESITDLSDDTDEPVIPLDWDIGIKLLARWYYYDEHGDIPKAEYALRAYRNWLEDKPSQMEEETRDQDKGVEMPTLNSRRRKRGEDFETSA